MGFFNEKMSDLTFTQADMSMRSRPLSRVENNVRPWQQVVHDHNKKPKRIIIKERGVTVKTLVGHV